jgi:hypothetical protein
VWRTTAAGTASGSTESSTSRCARPWQQQQPPPPPLQQQQQQEEEQQQQERLLGQSQAQQQARPVARAAAEVWEGSNYEYCREQPARGSKKKQQ